MTVGELRALLAQFLDETPVLLDDASRGRCVHINELECGARVTEKWDAPEDVRGKTVVVIK